MKDEIYMKLECGCMVCPKHRLIKPEETIKKPVRKSFWSEIVDMFSKVKV